MADKDKEDSIKKIMEENYLASKGFKIEDIAWLISKGKPLGTYATLGIWFDTRKGVRVRPKAAHYNRPCGLEILTSF